MNVTPVVAVPGNLIGLSATTLQIASDPNPYPSLQMRSVAPLLVQVPGTVFAALHYALPGATRVGDELEILLVDQSLFPTSVLKIHLDDYRIFLALRRQQGVFIQNEINTSRWPAMGITPGIYDVEVVHSGATPPGVPNPPSPAPQVPATPSRVVALSFLRSYLIT